MTPSKAIKSTLFMAAGALVVTTLMAAFLPADAGPIVRNRVKGALAGAAIGAIVGDPAKGAQIGAAVGTVKGVKKRRDRRRARVARRR